MHSVEMLGNDNSVAQPIGLPCSEEGRRHENNLAEQRDVVAKPIEPGVRVLNGQIDVDTGKEVIDWLVGEDICPTPEVIGTPHVDCEARVDRLTLVEDGIEGGERGPLFHRKSNEILLPGEPGGFGIE